MPLFGKRKRKESSNTPSHEQIAGATLAFTTMRGLWLDGRIALDILGPIDEAEVFVEMADLYEDWLRVAAQAWSGYENNGRGFLLFNTSTRELNYHTLEPGPEPLPEWLPPETDLHCTSYDPRTELVIVIYGFPEAGAPEASASLWVGPPDTWITPPVALRQWRQTRA